MIVISIQEAVGTGGVMVEDHDIGAVGGIGRGIGIVGHGIDIPAVVGIYLVVVEVAVGLAEHVGVFGDALYNKEREEF